MRSLLVSLSVLGATVAALLVAQACVPNPDIDGTKVAPIGSDADVPSCEALCRRLAALCGYAPVGCEGQCSEGYADEQKVCIGQAPSCRAALQECAPEEVEDGGEEEDAEADAEEEQDADTDAESELDANVTSDATSDAAVDAPDAPVDG